MKLADTLYHLLVMLEARDISLVDVLRELERRANGPGSRRGRARSKGMGAVADWWAAGRLFRPTGLRAEWASLRADTPLTLTLDDLVRLKSSTIRSARRGDGEIYLPLSRLLALYVAATQGLFKATQRFLGAEDGKVPYIIGVAGSVAVGKSRRRALRALLSRWPNTPKVELITTDGFLLPNKILETEKLMDKKGFPEATTTNRCCDFSPM